MGDVSCAGAPQCRGVGARSSGAGVSMERVLPGRGLSWGASLVVGSSPSHGVIPGDGTILIPWHWIIPVHDIIPVLWHHPW